MQDVEQVILLLVSGQGMLISLALLTAILNIENPMDFLDESGYLKKYILKQSKN